MKTILVIDDHQGIRNALADWLTLQGLHALTAVNGAVGLSLMGYHQPDLVLCDLIMPVMDGLETLRALRHDPHIRHTPFWLMTATFDLDQFSAEAQLEIDGLIKKPISVDDLNNALGEIV
ncbi:MAG: response regulator [Leptolyngbya sp. RL_3_1]|nr:response regulator [Leptolyngbya sp. RL_3_1]